MVLRIRDHILSIPAGLVVTETKEGAELFRARITRNAISAAARELRAMGASDAEIKAVLPAFGRQGVDVAKAWK